MNLLAIDQGNSRTKFWLKTAEQEVKWSCASGDESNCAELKNLPEDVIIAVASVNTVYCESLCSLFNKNELFVITPSSTIPLEISYNDSARLGIDRVMAAIGAVRVTGAPVITVLAGTATVVDIVNDDGLFCGGFIAPGVSSGAEGLYQAAPALPRIDIAADIVIPGTTPEECVKAGVVASSIGGIKEMISRLKKYTGKDCAVVVSGGWGKLAAEYIGNEVMYIEDLVLRGVMHTLECTCSDRENVL